MMYVEFIGGPNDGHRHEAPGEPSDYQASGGRYVLREADLRDGSGTSDRLAADWCPDVPAGQ